MKTEDENLSSILEELKDELQRQPPVTDLFKAYLELGGRWADLRVAMLREGSRPFAVETWRLTVHAIRILAYLRSTVDS